MNIQLRRVTLADQFIDTRHLLQHEGEFYVLAVGAPSLADDLRELLGWAAASFPQGGDTVEYFTDNIKHILRKHGEAEE